MSDYTSKVNTWIGLGCIAASLYFGHASGMVDLSRYIPAIPGVVAPSGPVAFPEPAADLKAAVAPITAKLATDKPAAGRIADAYRALADIIEQRTDRVTNTGQIAAYSREAGTWATANKLGPPGTADTIKAFTLAQLGDDAAPLDAAKRAKAVAVYRAIAWAAKEAAR